MKYTNSQKGPLYKLTEIYKLTERLSILWMRRTVTKYWCTFTIFVVFSSKTGNVENGQKSELPTTKNSEFLKSKSIFCATKKKAESS